MIQRSTLVALLALVVVAPACVSSDRFDSASNEIENQDEVISRLKTENGELRRERDEYKSSVELVRMDLSRVQGGGDVAGDVQRLRQELARLRDQLAREQAALREQQRRDEALASQFRQGADQRDFEVKNRPDGTAFSVAGNVLFSAGSAEVSSRGQGVLRQVADRIKSQNRDIRVEGHSDNTPVRRTKKLYPLGNLQLSGIRALNVAQFLIEKCGLSRKRMSYAGFGAEKPVADNGSEQGRSRNRRVEIVVLK